MTTITVRAERLGAGMELHIPDHGVTQARGLAEVETIVRDYLVADVGIAKAAAIEITIVPTRGGLEVSAAEIRDDNDRIARDAKHNADRAREVAHALLDAGLTGSDAAAVLGISKQRFSQLRRDLVA